MFSLSQEVQNYQNKYQYSAYNKTMT